MTHEKEANTEHLNYDELPDATQFESVPLEDVPVGDEEAQLDAVDEDEDEPTEDEV